MSNNLFRNIEIVNLIKNYKNCLKNIYTLFGKVFKMDLSRLLWVWMNLIFSSNGHPRIKSDLRHDFYMIFGKSLSLNAKYLIKKQVKSECKQYVLLAIIIFSIMYYVTFYIYYLIVRSISIKLC